MKNLFQRKKQLEKIIQKNYNESSALAYLLIHTGKLDKVIMLLDDKKTIPDTTSLIKKGFLTSEEQFVSILEYIIQFVNNEFWFLIDKNTIIEAILNFDISFNLLLSKKYIGNNEYIKFYEFDVRKICISNFYNALKFVNLSELINSFLIEHKIDINCFDIENEKEVIKLFEVLKLIAICNYNSYHLLYLFNTNMNDKTKSMFEIQLEILIERTIEREEQARHILNFFN